MAVMPLLRVKALWSGFSGAPGYSVLHFSAFDGTGTVEAQQAADDTRQFFQGLTTDLPGPVRIQVQPEVEVLNESNGQLTGYLAVTAPAIVEGLQPGPFSSAVGACISWGSDDVRNGRRIRGRTFLVPLANQAYDGDGTLSPATLTRFNAAAEFLRTAPSSLQIFARPTTAGASDGASAMVTAHRLTDKTAVLRSRRD